MGNAVDLTGQKFGRLKVVSLLGSQNNRRIWNCLCDCGTSFSCASDRLRSGNTTSCGCYHKELVRNMATTHGLSHLPEYKVWKDMKARCYNSRNIEYENYGGRGIIVCDEWKESFESFYRHVGSRPTAEHTIDRQDVNGNYEPGNVKWSTHVEQARNRRNNRIVSYKGHDYVLAELADILDLDVKSLHGYLTRGKTVEDAVEHLTTQQKENLAYRDWLTKKLIQRDAQVSIDFRRLELTRALIPDEFRGTGGTGKVILDIYNKIISTGDYDEGLLLYAKKYGTDPVYTPVNDGIDHINVYSKARTKIGVALSNFALTPFDHPKHGKFQSVEGFWYWLATGKQHEELRTLYGYKAKEIGKKFPRVQIDDFIPEIKKALLLKFEQNKELAQDLARTTLPLTHYYYYGDIHNAKVIPETKATWFVEYLETIRRYLKGEAYKIIIAGSRGIDQLETVKRAYRESGFEAVEIVSGGARGVDRLGEDLAKELQLPVERFIPNWDAQGRAAGMIRNHRMGDYAGALVACWDGTSPGTKDMIDYMKKLAKPSYVLMTQAVPS